MTLFRVYFVDHSTWDVEAESPDVARKLAQRWVEQRGLIVKCKVMREHA